MPAVVDVAAHDVAAHQHYFTNWLRPGLQRTVLTSTESPPLEKLRQDLLVHRDTAIIGCFTEIGVSAFSIVLYDIRRSILVPIVNTGLALLAAIGLHGALTLSIRRIQAHAIITSGLLIACLLNFFAEALLTEAGIGSASLPGWVVLLLLVVPYSVNLFCSLLSLRLLSTLWDFQSLEEQSGGILSPQQIEQQAIQMSGQDMCCVCMDRPKEAIFTPCGHRSVCHECGIALQDLGRRCPVCRASIGAVVRVYDT